MSSSASGPALPTLIVTGGASDGLQVQLASPGDEKTIGSSPHSHIRLTARNVDSGHARVMWEDGGVVLSDEGSAAGTFVNGERISTGHMLEDGDRISVGPPGSPESVRLLVRVPANLAAAAEAAPFLGGAAAASAPAATPARAPAARTPPPAAAPTPPPRTPAPAPTVLADEAPAFTLEPGGGEPLVFEETPPVTPSPVAAAAAAAPPGPPAAAAAPAIVFDEVPPEPAPPTPAPAPRPAPAATPPPAAAPAAKTPVPTPAASPPPSATPARKPRSGEARPEYMTEMPTIGGERVREPIDLPPAEAAARPAAAAKPRGGGKRTAPRVPRLALVAVAAAGLTTAAFLAYSRADRPPPVLSGVTPFKAEVGTTITITGTGFEDSAARNVVRFGSEVAAVTSASATSLTVTVPAVKEVSAGKNVPVTVEGGGGRSNALFVTITRLPRVTRLDPDVALPGTEVVIHGQNLDGTPLSVRIGGDKVEPRDVRSESVRVTVPEMPYTDGQAVQVMLEVGMDSARPTPLLLGRLPLVLEVSPASGPIGEKVTVKGRGFDASPSANRLTFGGAQALVFTASPTELTTAVPAAEATGTTTAVPVAVEAGGAVSRGRAAFTLVNPRSGLVRLRFFPAPVPQAPPDRHAYVSTELGPVLLLSGKGEAASTAERAGRVASALSGLVDSAASRAVTLEVREGSSPLVAVHGGPPVVEATAEDADGYAQRWDPGLKASRPTPRQLATYWAALLQDYLALFTQGQRPYRTAELSPRGRMLVDLYAESLRRGSGGVPAAAVAGLSPSFLRGMREMALLVPTAAATPGAAVAGRWEGTLMEGQTERRIELQLQVDGGRLAGSLTTRAGKLQVRTPLQDVSYEKGQLRFATASGGSTRQFRGALEGANLTGGVYKDGAAREAAGRFSLRYVE